MDEVFARRDMIAPARLKALSVKSDLRGAVRLGGHVAALAVTGTALLLTLGKLARGSLLHRAWRPDQLPLRGPTRIQPLDRVQDEEAQRDLRAAVRLHPALSARFRSDPALRSSPLYAGLGKGRGAGARSLYVDLLSPLGARADLLVHTHPAHPPLLDRRRHRALYSGGSQGGRDPRGALASCGLRRHRRALHCDGKLNRGETLACCRCW